MIGTVLDKYEVVQKVGEGGMATVYRGRHTTLRREVAVKILHPHLSSSPRNRRRFAREARAIEHLRHPNILEIFDYSGEDAEESYIVTEFVNGCTLHELMGKVGRLPSEVAARIGADLARALACAHASGILHRDVKPDNVMIRVDGVVKLMDFGIARFLDESHVTMTGALVGSPAYMSPEQAREGDLDARSDLFSLGTVLFHLVTGHLPFSGSNPSLVLKNIIEGNRPTVTELAPSTSATLADVIEGLLQTDRDGRPARALDVADALDRCVAEVGFDLNEPRWALFRFVEEPDAYIADLEAHLKVALLVHGKAYLARNDAIGALRLFNRLLSIDGENEAVLTLIQGLHTEPAPPRTSRWPLVGFAVLCALGGLGLIGWSQRAPLEAALPTPAPAGAAASLVPPPPPRAVRLPAAPDEAPAALPTAPIDPSPRTVRMPDGRKLTIQRRAPAEVVGAPPAPERLTMITLIATPPMYVADVVCDGKGVGTTRPPKNRFWLAEGEHTCELSNDMGILEPQAFTITASGTAQEIRRELRPRPVRVRVDASCPTSCNVSRDGDALGPITSAGQEFSLDRPDQVPFTLEVRCPDGRAWSIRHDKAVLNRTALVCAGTGTP